MYNNFSLAGNRQLDEYFAFKVMKWTTDEESGRYNTENGLLHKSYWRPTYSITDTWKLLDKAQDLYVLNFVLERNYCLAEMTFKAIFTDIDGVHFSSVGWTAQEAICKALYKFLESR
jgi:hypothetical protein